MTYVPSLSFRRCSKACSNQWCHQWTGDWETSPPAWSHGSPLLSSHPRQVASVLPSLPAAVAGLAPAFSRHNTAVRKMADRPSLVGWSWLGQSQSDVGHSSEQRMRVHSEVWMGGTCASLYMMGIIWRINTMRAYAYMHHEISLCISYCHLYWLSWEHFLCIFTVDGHGYTYHHCASLWSYCKVSANWERGRESI